MVVVSILLNVEFGRNNHRKDPPHYKMIKDFLFFFCYRKKCDKVAESQLFRMAMMQTGLRSAVLLPHSSHESDLRFIGLSPRDRMSEWSRVQSPFGLLIQLFPN